MHAEKADRAERPEAPLISAFKQCNWGQTPSGPFRRRRVGTLHEIGVGVEFHLSDAVACE